MARIVRCADRFLWDSEQSRVEFSIVVFVEIDTRRVLARGQITYVYRLDGFAPDRTRESMLHGFRLVLRKAAGRAEQKVSYWTVSAGWQAYLELQMSGLCLRGRRAKHSGNGCKVRDTPESSYQSARPMQQFDQGAEALILLASERKPIDLG
jgi:hypothetical protein